MGGFSLPEFYLYGGAKGMEMTPIHKPLNAPKYFRTLHFIDLFKFFIAFASLGAFLL